MVGCSVAAVGLSAGHAQLLDELSAHFGAQHSADAAALLIEFGRLMLRRADLGEPGQIDLETLAGHIESLLDFVDARGFDPHSVRVRSARNSRSGASEWVLEVSTDDAPFLVESVLGEIKARGLGTRRVVHPVIGTERNAEGRLTSVASARGTTGRESVQHYELDRELTDDDAAALVAGVEAVLLDLKRSVGDFGAMTSRIDRMIDLTREGAYHYSQEEVDEAVAFLRWLKDDNFVFLGFREYRAFDTTDGLAIEVVPGSGLGVLTDESSSGLAAPALISSLSERRRKRYEGGHLLVVSKTNRSSRVHRRARMDYIGIRRVGPDGQLAGEARLIGLFTAKAYMTPSSTIPVLRRKLDWIVTEEDLIEGSHDFRSVVQIFDSFPKEELFSVPKEEIARSITGLLTLEEHRHVQLFVRSDLLQRNVSVMVALPRDRFNATLRRKLQALILERFNGTGIDYRLALGESDTARIHFTVWVKESVPEPSYTELEADVVALTRTWDDRLSDALAAAEGPDRGRALAEHWGSRLPEYYKAATSLDVAVGDVQSLARLEQGDRSLLVGLQNEDDDGEQLTRLSFYHRGEKLTLSEMMPVLEHLGLNVVEEVPTRLVCGENVEILIHDFGVLNAAEEPLDLDACRERIVGLIEALWDDEAESDSLSRLIVNAGLDYRHVGVLRAYRTYWSRVAPHYTVAYVNDTLAAHPLVARLLIGLFRARFRPGGTDQEEAVLRVDLERAIDAVDSLEEDRILRGFMQLILATVRTNAYRYGRRSLVFKLRSRDVPNMPRPTPLFEIFVYNRDVEGIHLRGGMVARGGLRWSDRREDYRTEVLDLMKAQMTKNAIIVPTGAKGGFVVRHPRAGDHRPAARAAYEVFIRGLLDVTDNLVAGSVVPPPEVRIHDDQDPYLVVAADKGTAALSDVANGIAEEYDFWLGDAFASGGSAGYDHKALAITARGAWQSVKHHFHELGVDVDSDDFTAVGIGDMSGDVFGNGMLMSSHLRLVAAFDHRHIFIDPEPDAATGFAERTRLFALPTSSWGDYDTSLISAGGGVFSRSSKRIDLSPQMQRALGTQHESLTPNELISAILCAPVDLLWNGGIGTYVKASDETPGEVGDRTNDGLRVDGTSLRCRVVAEGGNLGFTQRGRIEYALGGGRINTDFIDNSGGVHCSDREVNLKILLGLAIERGMLPAAERNELIAQLADDVTRRVVYDNFLQAQILTQEHDASRQRMDAYEDLMVQLEETEILDRRIERLPSSDDMMERTGSGVGMTTPELAVLLAYAKRQLTDDVLASDLPDAPEMQRLLAGYFPAEVVARFGEVLGEHPLRREILATVIANEVINSEGITFVARLAAETGHESPAIVKAYRVARVVTEAGRYWEEIEKLEGKLEPAIQHDLLLGIDELVESTARWYLAEGRLSLSSMAIESTAADFAALGDLLAATGPEEWVYVREAQVGRLVEEGVPFEVARRHAYRDALVHAPDIIELARERKLPLDVVAKLSFDVAAAFELDVLADRLAELPRTDRWQRSAALTVADDLLRLRRRLTRRVAELVDGGSSAGAVDRYVAGRGAGYERLMRLLRSVALEGGDDVASLVVAVRRIESVM
jgi:glutamate dehydrogenase